MSGTSDALKKVGVDLGRDADTNLIGAIDQYTTQNLSPSDLALAQAGLKVLSTATGIGALSPGVVKRGTGGEWEAVHYANDLNAHHPKFKFLFKVNFNGFPGGNFSYFIHRCDKPKVKFNHTEVNYYNFRTKVLTSVTYDPLNFTFLDEIGNTVNSFFALYTAARSKQGNGKASIDGGSEFSSSVPYENGYSSGKTVEIQQIFANGLATNIFTLINARIDSLEFDELNMEQTAGSMMNCTVSFDAITCRTTGSMTINSWGQTDILRGGGTSGLENAGQPSSNADGQLAQSSATGGGIGGLGKFVKDGFATAAGIATAAYNSANKVVDSLKDLVTPNDLSTLGQDFKRTAVGSMDGLVSSNIQSTLTAITSGSNLTSGGTGNTGVREGPNPNIDDATRASAQAWVTGMNP